MTCFGLKGAPCDWILFAERQLSDLVALLGRFGLTGAIVAGGLILSFMVGRRVARWLWS